MRSRIAVFLLLLLTVLLLGTIPAAAQTATARPQGAQTRPTAPDQAVAEELTEDALQDQRFNRDLDRQLREHRQRLLQESMNRLRYGRQDYGHVAEAVGIFLVIASIVGAVMWLIRTGLEHLRWNRIARIQTEMHNKLLERMASSQELLTYMETEAGRRFLEATPFAVERAQAPVFPYSRILWSAQIGVVAMLAGSGLLWLQGRLPEDATEELLVFGTLALALGAGFILSAGLSYILSRSFGLMQDRSRSDHASSAP